MSTELDIDARNVRKVFGGSVVALDKVDLTVERGSFFSLLGPSGCGKSTLLRLLSGLDEPTEGEILIRGTSVKDTPGHKRATNLVFQRLALFPQMTIAENVAFGPKVHRRGRDEIRRTVDEKLELVGLSELAKRYPHEISGGQQQRVAIARALANEPAVLLLDEPLSSLDQKLRVQMQRALKRIQKDSATTFVYVTHDQHEAFTMSDAIAVMNNGVVEQVGSPREVYNRPASRFVASFVGDTNVIEQSDLPPASRAGEGAIAVKAEVVQIGTTLANELENRFAGTVTDVSFGGSKVSYRVGIESGATIAVESSAVSAFHADVGENVEIGWPSDAVVELSR
ncbi:ABC transporter ATP-binding protein [Paramicrobacterium agarici]|uniref:ABC-type quaternary amine transporter n=1 Tax=Paramicrobacterium agarici TaxID=630514 RepID=A0A2A9DUA5_9MICO|nr:ABC transporter ATP-binding protein [Microbacterium agarici]PFG29946.1 spermidine/putrescine transport system ATP-binding protein [Microbacterium agarici]